MKELLFYVPTQSVFVYAQADAKGMKYATLRFDCGEFQEEHSGHLTGYCPAKDALPELSEMELAQEICKSLFQSEHTICILIPELALYELPKPQ